MATIKDVAKLAGVALSTASYALNHSNKISDSTKRKVHEAAKQLNYSKNGFAADLKRTKTNTIAIILSDLSGPFYSELIKGVQDVTASKHYGLVACSSVGGDSSTATKFLTEKRVDGAIVLAHNITDDLVFQAAQQGMPVVVLDRFLKDENIYCVEVDNWQGGYNATSYLIEQEIKEIGFISGPITSRDNILRTEGYKQALNDAHLTYQSKWHLNGGFTKEGGYHATKLLLAQGNLPEALFYANDEMVIGGLEAFKEKNIQIPEDISIIGFDDIQLAGYLQPALTTVKQPKYEAGAMAAHIIFQLLNGERPANHCMLTTELVKRSTVKEK
ncbi:LacI family transcriptional regulator [Alkalihalobacillus xiaoxiensis]|uniref:LacI family transcriptional regulator n=1 Tax=Shouchella xiaoxiensis TaxID=766895 RepID=A0ABS2SYA8_9BACI|nr:LacI family DNA-binding transcriptional regulator [Shouchella xiaoxiensis]MBM7840493.1 LacI family transcriptional regulator [Shouchella xiaoxiensis]